MKKRIHKISDNAIRRFPRYILEVEIEKHSVVFIDFRKIKNLLKILEYVDISQSLVDEICGFLLQQEFREISIDKKISFLSAQLHKRGKVSKVTAQVLPEKMLFHVLLGTLKHRSWSYEAEWRCIRVGAYGEADFVPKIKSVYLGSKFDKANISDIEDIARERDFNVYQLSSTSFTQQRYSFKRTPVFEHNTVEI